MEKQDLHLLIDEKKTPNIFFIIIFYYYKIKLFIHKLIIKLIISVGDYANTTLDLLKETLIAILSDTDINENNREQIKELAVKSLIKRNIKESEIKRRIFINIIKNNLML